MSLGTPRRVRQRAAPHAPAPSRSTIRCNGGFTFAEDPYVEATDARIIWHADFDPGTLSVSATPADWSDPDAIDPNWIERWLTIADDDTGRQHAVLSDGRHHIRVDIDEGRLVPGNPVVLHYRLYGVESAARRLLPLRQLLQLIRDRRFPVALFPGAVRNRRAIELLRVRDALDDHASHRDIARVLFGDESVADDRRRGSDSLRSRVRRLVRDARTLTMGGYRRLMIAGAAARAGRRRESYEQRAASRDVERGR